MLHRYLVFVSLIVIFSSCYTHRSLLEELKVESYTGPQLPALQLSLDRASLENAYLEQIVEERASEDTELSIATDYRRVMYLQGDPRINDVTTLFERMVKDRWTSPYGEKQGYVDCRMTYHDVISTFSLYPLLTFGSLGLSMLLGVPTAKRQIIVELAVEIYDHKDILIGRYQGVGDEVYVVGGYRQQTGRKANLRAVKEAFFHIEQALIQDHARLVASLEKP